MLKNENINLKEMCRKTYAELVLFGSLKRAAGSVNLKTRKRRGIFFTQRNIVCRIL